MGAEIIEFHNNETNFDHSDLEMLDQLEAYGILLDYLEKDLVNGNSVDDRLVPILKSASSRILAICDRLRPKILEAK